MIPSASAGLEAISPIGSSTFSRSRGGVTSVVEGGLRRTQDALRSVG